MEFLVPVPAHFLKHVGPDAHAAGAAHFVLDFRERRSSVLARDAIVMIEQILGDGRDGRGAFGFELRAFLFRGCALGFESRAIGFCSLFNFLQRFFGCLDLPLVLLTRNHFFEEPVLGFGDFIVGHLRLVLESLEGVVGLHLIRLVLVFLGLFFPLLDVELVFLALFKGVQMGGLGVIEFGASRSHTRIQFRQSLRKSCQARAHVQEMNIDRLQINQVLEDG